ncbi:hypothetical protein [Variovorax paradoxus]|uniref:hypothetical protein n=1 Tax=Variovorax paradoxus TaxID=34073 RepID=UPI003ED03C18
MATVQTLRISKFGLQPLLVQWEIAGRLHHVFLSAIVWPLAGERPTGYELTARFSIQAPRQQDDDEPEDDYMHVTRVAALERAKIRAGELAAAQANPVDSVALEHVDLVTVRAWRSLNFYPGFASLARQGGDVGQLAQEVSPIDFGDETNR